jgi:hypothetical protein
MRELLVIVLEVVSLVLFASAICVYLWRFDPALALAGTAVGVLVESLIVSALAPKGEGE